MSKIQQTLSFVEIDAQYVPGAFLVETQKGPEFRHQKLWIRRKIEQLCIDISYDLSISVPSIIKKARLSLTDHQKSLKELAATIKTLFCVKRIVRVQKLLAKPSGKFFDEVDSIACAALKVFAQKEGLSELECCLAHGKMYDPLMEQAYEIAKKDSFPKNLSPKNLSLLAEFAIKKKDYDLALRILNEGGTLPKLTPSEEQALFTIALHQSKDTDIANLIQKGYHCNFTPPFSPVSFPHACVERGMTEAIQAMITKKEPLTTSDREGNTLLHYAFLLKNFPLAQILLPVIDPNTRNNHGQTPFVSLMNPLGDKAQELSKTEGDVSDFLKKILCQDCSPIRKTRIEAPHYRDTIKSFLDKNDLPDCDDVELAFLISNDCISEILIKNMTRETLEQACSSLSKKYPRECVERFFLFSFSIIPDHYNTGKELVSLPDSPGENPDLNELVKLMQKDGSFSRQQKRIFAQFLDNINNRTFHYGTPRPSPALEDYYQIVRKNLKHIIVGLKRKENPELTRKTLDELVKAAAKCGGRWFAVAQLQAQIVCLDLKVTPRLNLERSLAYFRTLCLEGITSYLFQDREHSVHTYTGALAKLGGSLGIPGCKGEEFFEDVNTPLDFDAQDILLRFKRVYTPEAIIYEWILPQCKDDRSFLNDYIDLHAELVPETWIVPNATEEVTRQEKIQDFLERVVYDENSHLQPSGVRILLEKLHVIQCECKTS